MNYSVSKYGKEWAIFCAHTRTFVLFGTKKEMTKRCQDLNREDNEHSKRLVRNFPIS